MIENRLLRTVAEQQLGAERKLRRAYGMLMRGRIAALIDAPREEDPLAHLTVTRGKSFSDKISLLSRDIGFHLEADHEETAKAGGLSIKFEGMGETFIIHENGDAEIRQDGVEPMRGKKPPVANLEKVMEYYAYLGLVESAFPISEQLPPGVIRFPSPPQEDTTD